MKVIYKSDRTDVCLSQETVVYAKDVFMFVSKTEGYKKTDFYLTCNGKLLNHGDVITSSCIIRSHLSVLGGKGGFGSMLRALGARIEKTTNHEACRDLSGRRMRDVNNEKQIAEWLKEKETKDEEREKKRQAKLERILNPKYTYEDKGYTSNLQLNAEKVDEALQQALQSRKEKTGEKRKVDDSKQIKVKKTRLWMGVDEDESEDESDPENIVSLTEDSSAEQRTATTPDTTEKKHCTNGNEDMKANDNTDNGTKEVESEKNGKGVESTVQSSDNVNNSSDKPADLKDTTKSSQVDEKLTEKPKPTQVEPEALDLSEYNSAAQLEAVGLDRLKSALMFLGMKCGGTLQDRAKRLFLTKDTPLDQLDSSLFAKVSKKKKK
ncbi:splicing regulator SDE2-like [Hydractinia symbiolongicarpus]|uniref:splicing regulator SDE2-like n=1 Tax=Hydractinia symbiolongicarpus TaxID=13093 RepID=UPI0025519437|nr:splicing regulator SDE2-like [Hydractinia symbiolongicarpus]